MGKIKSAFTKIIFKYYEYILTHEHIFRGEKRRNNYWNCHMKHMGRDCLIRPNVKIDFAENISIGDSVSIQDNCFLSGLGGIVIGNDVSLGNGVKIVSTEHEYSQGIIRNNPLIKKKVIIGNNVWIGMNASILAGSCIHDNTVVGAGAVVKGEIGPGVFVGVPARFIKRLED